MGGYFSLGEFDRGRERDKRGGMYIWHGRLVRPHRGRQAPWRLSCLSSERDRFIEEETARTTHPGLEGM